MIRDTRSWIGLFAIGLLVSSSIACGRVRPGPNQEVTAAVPSPTHAATLTTAPFPTYTPAPAPDDPPAVQDQGLAVLTHNGFTDNNGAAHVVGEVYNHTDLNWEYVTVTCAFYDQGGHLLAEQETYALIDILLPGEKAPFKVSLWEPAADVESYVLSTRGQETSRKVFTGIEFTQDHAKIKGDALVIIGQVINRSEVPGSNVRIAASIFDRDDRIVDVGFAHPERDVFVQDSVSPFVLTIDEISGKPERYELIAYGQRAQDDELERLAQIKVVSTLYRAGTSSKPALAGEVVNLSEQNATSIKVFAALYDRDDALVDTAWNYVWAEVLEPGARSPFDIALLDPPQEIDRWAVWVEGIKTDDQVQGKLVFQKTANTVSDDQVATFTGLVRNDGTETMSQIEVAVTVYDGEGNIVNTGWEWLDRDLAPGASMPFSLAVETSKNANSFELYVQGTIKA